MDIAKSPNQRLPSLSKGQGKRQPKERKPYIITTLCHPNTTEETVVKLHPCQQRPSGEPACELSLGYNKAL